MSHSSPTASGMSCEACTTTIEGARERLPGVASVAVDLERRLVTVEHDEHQALQPRGTLALEIEADGAVIGGGTPMADTVAFGQSKAEGVHANMRS